MTKPVVNATPGKPSRRLNVKKQNQMDTDALFYDYLIKKYIYILFIIH